VLNDIGAVEVDVPQDRNGEFTPQIVPKGARRLSGSRWPPQRPR
jgi:transposase-like protein